MSYGNYVQGSVDTTNNGYNLLISGAPSGYTQSGLMIGGDTATTYGVRLAKDATNNAYVDLRGDASNELGFRYKDNSSGTVTSMLSLTNDSALTGSGYGATVSGRVNASAYYVGQADTRTPANAGVYMAMDGANVGKFSINKGTGTGGFQFNTYNANGTLAQSNLNLLASGVVQAAYYTATGNASDSEAVAIAGFDSNGNSARNYAINARYRAAEARLTAIETDLTNGVPNKVNEIITRLNGLDFFSQNIATIAAMTPPAPVTSPAPAPAHTYSSTNINGEWFQVQYPAAFILTSYKIGGGFNLETNSPIGQDRTAKNFKLLGSNNGTTWYLLDTQTNATYYDYSLTTFTPPTISTAYSYYRMICTQQASQPYTYWMMNNFNLYSGASMWPPVALPDSGYNTSTSTTTLSGQSYGNGVYTVSSSGGARVELSTTTAILGRTVPPSLDGQPWFVITSDDYATYSGVYSGSVTTTALVQTS